MEDSIFPKDNLILQIDFVAELYNGFLIQFLPFWYELLDIIFMVPDKARNQQRLSLTCLAGRKSESLDACMMFADCVLFWVFFNLKTWFLGAKPSLISLFLPFKNQLTHINYIILRRDLFDYSQECQNCHKIATIAHITASTSKTYFFSLSQDERISLC